MTDDGARTTSGRIAVFGGGKMGEALIAGLLRGGHAVEDVVVVERYAERADELARAHGIAALDARAAVDGSAVLLFATKPQDLEPLLTEVSAAVDAAQVVVSVAAGVTAARIEAALPPGVPVVRAMPNTPALVGQGMTAIAAGTHAGAGHLDLAERLLSAVGPVVRVAEHQLDAVTALSGSGPAYFFYVVESMIDAGVQLGLPRPLATQLVVQTALGSATMLEESGEHPGRLREAVTSPGGTTAAALRALDDGGVRSAFAAAVEAAARRSRELGAS